MKLKGLGRGLDALLAGNEAQGREQQRSLAVGNLQPGMLIVVKVKEARNG